MDDLIRTLIVDRLGIDDHQRIAPVTGTFCKNSSGSDYPAPTALLLGFVDLITTANPGER